MVRVRYAVILVSILVLIAGCSSGGPTETPIESSTPTSTPIPTPTETATHSSTATSSPSASPSSTPTPRGPSQGTEWSVTITRVIDGDTVEARFPNGEIDTLRLLGVDTPETTLSRVSPEEFEGIPDTMAGRDHLFNWGQLATDFAEEQLDGKPVRVEVDPEADRRGSFGRLLVYIYVDGENFNKLLLTNGYARKFDSSFSKRSEFADAESTAQANNVGLWDFEEVSTPISTATPTPTPAQTPSPSSTETSSPGNLEVVEIHEDAEGNDHYNENDEYIAFKNTGDARLDLTGWRVADEAGHTYHFPSGFTLDPGAKVVLRTGSGTDTDTTLYWGSDAAIWNNGGDTIFVYDEDGQKIIEREYS